MPPAHRGPTGSPMDRWTDASPSAISSGFQTAMSLGPQPRLNFEMPPSGLNTTAASFNTDDEDEDEDEEEADAPAKKADGKATKGKKGAAPAKSKDAKAAQHRKEQNRAAQREFRQRKQQYIRALEARVELLSSDHDTQVNRLRYALRHLLAENNSLRGIVGSLAHFIGARSIGGCLVEAGMTRQMLENTMNSSSEKTMSEAWANWPGAGECEMLKQLRKESNIPADGLPESKLVNYFRDANGKTAADNSADAEKKKRTADDAAGKDSKRKRKTNDTSASRNSSPARNPDQRIGSGQPSVASPQSMASNEMRQPWPQQQQQQQPQQQSQQQQQQQQIPTALPSQFWQPTPFGGSLPMRNDVDSMFAQTLLGGGNADMSGLAAMAGSLFPTDNQSVFSPQQAMTFNNLIPTPGSAMPPGSTPGSNFNFLGFGGVPTMVGAAADSTLNSAPFAAQPSSSGQTDATAIVHLPASPATGGVEGTVLRSGTRASPEQIRNLRRRSARAIAQVNRIWAQRGANNFLNLPVQYPLDEEDLKFLEQQEATNPHIKIAYMRLPNEWDEGDIAGGNASGSPDGSQTKTRYDIEKQAEYFLQISYHLHNHSLNPSYSLPPSLRPTALQQSTPHDHAIDLLPNAPLRDKLIQNPGLETHNVTIDVIRFLSPSDGDMNIERNWVLTLPFFVRYPQLADPAMVANMNRQRVMRGEKEVTIDDIWREHRAFTEYCQAKLKEIS